MLFALDDMHGGYAWSKAWRWHRAGSDAQLAAIVAFVINAFSALSLFGHQRPDHYVALQIAGLIAGLATLIASPLFIRYANRRIREEKRNDATDPRRFSH
jgi:hypothetical protein